MFKKKKKSYKKDEYKTLIKFKIISRLFIFLSIILFLWAIIVAAGVIINDMDPFWAYLSLENWVLLSIILIIIFAIIEIIYYIYTIKYSDKIIEFEEVEPETIHGKKVYIYTNPKNAKGGVFSRTYIQICNDSVLRIRNQIIPPEEL
jgi:hypothetical protein